MCVSAFLIELIEAHQKPLKKYFSTKYKSHKRPNLVLSVLKRLQSFLQCTTTKFWYPFPSFKNKSEAEI